MPCLICRRMARGFAHGRHRFDSMECLNRYTPDFMNDFTPDETAAQLAGAAQGAEYLASIKKHDLRDLTFEEATTFLGCIFKEYHLAIARAETARLDPPVPFGK